LKFEARNSKSETNPNDQNKQCFKQFGFGFPVLDFLILAFILTLVCFEFRYSDFGFVSMVAWHDEFS